MLPLTWYLLKVIICSGILYGYYWLSLRNKVFHKYNRFYLMASVLLSMLLPLIKIDFWQQQAQQQNSMIRVLQAVSSGDEYMDNITVTTGSNNFDIEQLYPFAYMLVSLILLIIFFHTLFVIFRLLRKYPKQTIDNVSFINTDAKSTPFSFLNYIFWNYNIDVETTTGNQIFKHELAHVQEGHTYDKLFINIVLIFFWCNPFYWLYRKELNMIHEFIADKKAVEDNDTEAFAAMILQATYPQHRFQLTNNFFYSPIKRRLLMLTKNRNPKVNYFGRIMVLPLLVLIFAAFTFKVKSNERKALAQQVAKNNAIYLQLTKTASPVDTAFPAMLINMKHSDTNYLKTADYKSRALIIIEDKEIGNFGADYIYKNNVHYSSIVVYSPAEAIQKFGAKGKYGVIKLTQNSVMIIQADSIFFDDKTNAVKLTGNNTQLKGNFSDALIYCDGKEITSLQLKDIVPGKIESVNIIKGEKLDEVIDAKGKKSIINVFLKPESLEEVIVTGSKINNAADTLNALAAQGYSVTRRAPYLEEVIGKEFQTKPNTDPLYVINDQVQSRDFNLNSISVNDIERIDVFKDKTAIDEYGDYGKNGVIKITTRLTPLMVQGFSGKIANSNSDSIGVLYIGVENHISLPSGVDPEDAMANISNGSINGTAGNYTVVVYPRGVLTITILKKGTNTILRTIKYYAARRPETENMQAAKLNEVTVTGRSHLMASTQLPTDQQWLKAAEEKYTDTLWRVTDNKIFFKTEVEPGFPGGNDAWKAYLMRNINPSIPAGEGWKPGTYTVIVQFIVHTDGSVSDVIAVNYKGSKTAQHCIDLIKKSANWSPALQNGRAVNAYRKQPVTFLVEGKPITEIYSVPLKVHLLTEGKLNTYYMVSNGKFTAKVKGQFYLNGELCNDPRNIKPGTITAIESYDEGAGKLNFGEKGKYGVTLITTKG